MSRPTYEDADIMLRLVQAWPVEPSDWIWSDQFVADHGEFMQKYPDGEEFSKVRGVLNWYETIGTLYKHGLLNEDLLFDWLAVYAVWDRVKDHAFALRRATDEPRMYENFEAMADAQRGRAASERQTA
jgi:hypothetical protein